MYLKGFCGVEYYLEEVIGLEANKIKGKLQGGPEFKLYMEGEINEDAFWNKIIHRNNWDIKVHHFKT